MCQWSLVERKIDGPIVCIGVYDDFAVAVGQMFLTINETIEDHFQGEFYNNVDYDIRKLEKLDYDTGHYTRLNLAKTQSYDSACFIYYLLCSEKKGLENEN
jgi:hypothetical protein